MILLFIILYVFVALCVGYGCLIVEYKKSYRDKYSFSETLKLTRFNDEILWTVPIAIFFPLALVVYLFWLIGHLIVKLLDKIVK